MAKHAYAASNRKDEYPQMTAWLDRREKVIQHIKYVRRRQAAQAPIIIEKPPPTLLPQRRQLMAKHPTFRAVSLAVLHTKYGAMHIEMALARFIIHCQHPALSKAQVELAAATFPLGFTKLPVYHRLKFVSHDLASLAALDDLVVDSIHAESARDDKYGAVVPGRFDTAVINFGEGGEIGVEGKFLNVAFSSCL